MGLSVALKLQVQHFKAKQAECRLVSYVSIVQLKVLTPRDGEHPTPTDFNRRVVAELFSEASPTPS